MSAVAAHRTPPVRDRIRAAIERALPWFDRDEEERRRAAFDRELARSKAVRAKATATIQQGYREYADRMRK